MMFPSSTNAIRQDSDINRLLRTFRHEPTDRVPNHEYLICQRNVSAILGKPAGMSWELDAADYVTLVTRIGMDAVGGPIFLKQGQIFSRVPARTLTDWEALRLLESEGVIQPAVLDHAKLERFFRAIANTQLGIWAHLTGGLTAVYDAMGLENFCLALYDDPAFVEHLLDMIVEDNVRILRELLRYDFSFIHIGDDLGSKSGLLFQPALLKELWVPRIAQTVAPVHQKKTLVTFHSDGKIDEAIPWIIELGFCSLNPIEPYGMNIYDIKQRFGDKLALVGNIDVAGPLAFGTPAQVEAEVREHIDRLAIGGGYVGATSHSVLDDISPENFHAMIRAIHKYGQKQR
jgi:uroporphyrinogen decarboxylase